MPRPLWSGAVSFGLVNIPVKMFSAVRPKDVHFHQLHDKDGVRIRQKRVCPADGEEVPYEHVVKGYELAKDEYVVVTPEELEAAGAKATHTIDIERFVDGSQLDPIYFESAYYLAPDKAAGKPYALLLEAMRRAKRVAIARLVLRTKEYLVALRPLGDLLAVETMYFADEVVDASEIGAPTARSLKLGERELKMADQLVAALSDEFDPAAYHDEYRERLEALIAKKAEGAEVVTPPPTARPAQVVDLVAALEASLRARGDATPSGRKEGSLAASKRGGHPARSDGEEPREAPAVHPRTRRAATSHATSTRSAARRAPTKRTAARRRKSS